MTDRKKPGVAFWAAVVVGVALVGYPLSFGPACWLYDTVDIVPFWVIDAIYRPLSFTAGRSQLCTKALAWYSLACTGGDLVIYVDPVRGLLGEYDPVLMP